MTVAAGKRRVSLPGGLVLGDSERLAEAELRAMTGYDEEWLAENAGLPSAVLTTGLLNNCVQRVGDRAATPELLGRLLVADRDYLMAQLRRLTMGDLIQAVVHCPACQHPMDLRFHADDLPVKSRPQQTPSYTVVVGAASKAVRFRLPTGTDQESVSALDAAAAVDLLFERCVLEVEAAPLSESERAEVIAEMERVAPQLEIEMELSCPECSHHFLTPFDVPAYFVQEMRIESEQLLREVHLLAFYYHWSEPEILGLTRHRRRAYLDLLADMLRED